MRNRCRFVKSESGQILVWVIGLLVLASLIIAPLLVSAFGGFRTSTIRQERMQELYAADTGIEDALNWIFHQGSLTRLNESGNIPFPAVHQQFSYPLGFDTNKNDRIDVPDELSNINDCNVGITGNRTGDMTYTVTSTATSLVNKGHHVKVQVTVDVHPLTIPGSLITQPPVEIYPPAPPGGDFSYAIASLQNGADLNAKQGNITGDILVKSDINLIGGQNVINGNVYSLGDLTLNQQSDIKGNASATGNILLEQGAIIEQNAWSDASITLDGSNGIWGDAYAQTDVNVNSGHVGGSAWANHNVNVSATINQSATANYDINGTGTIEGWAYYLHSLQPSVHVGNSSQLTVAKQIPQPIMPQLSEPPANPGQVYYDWAITGGTYTPTQQEKGTLTISGTGNTLGPKYINGNLAFANNAELTLTGTVYVKGTIDMNVNKVKVMVTKGTATPACLVAEGQPGINTITIKNNNIINTDQIPLIMAVYGNIDVKNGTSIYAAIYAPNGSVTLENNSKVDGAIVAQQIAPDQKEGKFTAIYNPAVQTIPGLPGGSGPGPSPSPTTTQPPPEQGPSITVPAGVHVISYVVLEE